MIALNATQLAKLTGARIDRAEVNTQFLLRAMEVFNINTPSRISMFCAQIGHESGGLRYATELWGPTPQQKRYERNFNAPWPSSVAESRQAAFSINRLAYGLGNEKAGDGSLYRGRCWIQVTGRNNYSVVQLQLRMAMPGVDVPDFIKEPVKLAEPLWSAMSAGNFWHRNNLNHFADAGDFDGASDTINRGHKTERIGDANGYADRLAIWEAGQKVFV